MGNSGENTKYMQVYYQDYVVKQWTTVNKWDKYYAQNILGWGQWSLLLIGMQQLARIITMVAAVLAPIWCQSISNSHDDFNVIATNWSVRWIRWHNCIYLYILHLSDMVKVMFPQEINFMGIQHVAYSKAGISWSLVYIWIQFDKGRMWWHTGAKPAPKPLMIAVAFCVIAQKYIKVKLCANDKCQCPHEANIYHGNFRQPNVSCCSGYILRNL